MIVPTSSCDFAKPLPLLTTSTKLFCPASARSFAISTTLCEKTYEQCQAVGRTVARLAGDFSGLRHPEREIKRTKPFTMLPSALWDPEVTKWMPVEHGRWCFEDHITLGESRAVVRWLDIIVKEEANHRSKVISLQDNAATAGALMKGRSPAGPLNYLQRKKAARTLAADLRAILPWVESHKQPADSIS